MATPAPYSGLPAEGFVRQSQLIPDPKKPEKPAPVPFSHATLWRKVKAGEFPQPVKLGPKITAWRAADVRAWLEAQGKSAEAA